MRTTSLGPLALVALLALGCDDGRTGTDGGPGGGEDGSVAAGPRATLSWQVRCDTEPCPPTEPPARTIDAANGEDGHEIFCDLTIEGSERRMNLTARRGDAYGIEVRGARIGLEGGRLIGSLCQVRVFEETDVTLLEPCQASNPTAERACQIQRIDIRDVDGVPTLSAELRCLGAEAEGDPSRLRDVTAASAASGYAELTFRGCLGL